MLHFGKRVPWRDTGRHRKGRRFFFRLSHAFFLPMTRLLVVYGRTSGTYSPASFTETKARDQTPVFYHPGALSHQFWEGLNLTHKMEMERKMIYQILRPFFGSWDLEVSLCICIFSYVLLEICHHLLVSTTWLSPFSVAITRYPRLGHL